MKISFKPKSPLILATAGLGLSLLSACVTTEHVPYGARDEKPLTLGRTVEYEINDRFYQDAPECVTILPVDTGGDAQTTIHLAVEDAVSRYMRMKMTRVIDRTDRRLLERRLAVDLSHSSDRSAYARTSRCRHFVRIRPWGGGNQYLVFWSRESIGAEVSIVRADDNTPLWKARHVASRSDGGLPLNPFSAVFSAYEANALSSDSEIPLSLADDVARNIVATIPTMRRSTITQYSYTPTKPFGTN
ncbi:hypothetical protein [Aestuariispira insulae]|uniref:Lipoprotein n=1 Tax=Aestuariispira insulae TaxID=1461337 RepID=A0A3D9HVN2_9PROT|nr:hypothetical protein [Aestuariispira insulae]RED53552.1 hypothetical protein DFP90_101343 [Aestuariispira insulae]